MHDRTGWHRTAETSAAPAASQTSAAVTSASRRRQGGIVLGISGARRNAAVAASVDGELLGVCEQERVTRVRGVGLQPGALPAEAIAAVLGSSEPLHSNVRRVVASEGGIILPVGLPEHRLDHHLAHATTAARVSGFDAAAVLVCDQHGPCRTSVWSAERGRVVQRDWPPGPGGFATWYSEAARVFGLRPGQEHQLEALARLDGARRESTLELFEYHDGALWPRPGWQSVLANALADVSGDPVAHRGALAGAFQRHLGRLLLDLVADIRTSLGQRRLCLGGGLFFNTYFNTLIEQSGIFDRVFVPPNPGNAGVAVGAALAIDPPAKSLSISPFLGPEYDLEEIKRTLDNCKLSYRCVTEGELVMVAVEALKRGRLVGWFQGRMEWGHRALGHRSILANPASPYVLENLNAFLKHRQRYRAYGLSVPEEDAPGLFTGPRSSRFMEYEYQLADKERLRHVVPDGVSALRVQTIAADEPALQRFHLLHQAFGEEAGIPVLVNTSFNGFSEPIVCSPRDAVRVFYGTGLDVLILDRFVLQK